MPTPRQNLEASIKRLEARGGPESRLVKDFKAQLAAMPKQTESTRDRFVGAGAPQNPEQADNFDEVVGNSNEKALMEMYDKK